MEILGGEQMRRVDRRAIEGLGIPGATLMENAGRGVADRLLVDVPGLRELPVTVLCGKGNNGGDGWVIARRLHGAGVDVVAVTTCPEDDLAGDAGAMFAAARAAGVAIVDGSVPGAESTLAARLEGGGWVVDALLGTGTRGGARGRVADWIEVAGASGAPVAAVDLPSGLDADLGEIPGVALRASRTYTLCRPKPALVLEPAASLAGVWTVVPIGIPDAAVAEERSLLEWLDDRVARTLVAPRPRDSHKGRFGHLLLCAGSRGKSGAAVLAGRGALRGGVGLLTVAAPASIRGEIAVQQPEWMTEGLADTEAGTFEPAAAGRLLELAEGKTALALGPGLGRDPAARSFAGAVLSAVDLPAVVDADGLAGLPSTGARVAGDAPLVLTPHPGEAATLLGSTADEIQADRCGAAVELARGYRATVVLKGHRTIVAGDDGRLAFNASGNPGMATGGTGDVLTGLVGAMLCHGLDGYDAARLAVFVHGNAGDRAAARLGEAGLIATDVAEAIAPALAGLAPGSRGAR